MLRHEKERSGALGKRSFTMIAGATALFALVAGSSGCSSGKPTELVSIRELSRELTLDVEGLPAAPADPSLLGVGHLNSHRPGGVLSLSGT